MAPVDKLPGDDLQPGATDSAPLSKAFEQSAVSEKSTAQTLLEAIDAGDTTAFAAAMNKALKEKIDLNQLGGVFLHHAAEKNNALFMKELMLADADAKYALNTAQNSASQARLNGLNPDERAWRSDAHAKEYSRWCDAVNNLNNYISFFTSTQIQIESARQQQKLLQELREIKVVLTEMVQPTPHVKLVSDVLKKQERKM